MVAIKDIEMPKACCEFNKETGEVSHCLLYDSCRKRDTIKVGVKPESCPLVEVSPKKARWMAVPTEDGRHEMTCSCCGYVATKLLTRNLTEEMALSYLKDRIEENKFCPNCGADTRKAA